MTEPTDTDGDSDANTGSDAGAATAPELQQDPPTEPAPPRARLTDTHTTERPAVNPPALHETTHIHVTRPETGIDWEAQQDGGESKAHLYGKFTLHQRRQAKQRPWFRGTYEFERTVGDWVPDCLITGAGSRAWIEFVASPGGEYERKTRAALRFGYPIYWVICDSAERQREAVREALSPELDEDVCFGRFDPDSDTLVLGDAITFDNCRVPIESVAAFNVSELMGYRAGAAHIPRLGASYDLGWVRIGETPRRVYAGQYGGWVRFVPPGERPRDIKRIDLSEDDTAATRPIHRGIIERISPIPRLSTDERRTSRTLPTQDIE